MADQDQTNPLQLKLDPEAINRYVAQKVLDSVIGKQLERIVNAYVSKLSVGYANPLEDIVASEVRLIIADLLSKEFRPQIVESLRKQLADQITDEFISKLLLKALER